MFTSTVLWAEGMYLLQLQNWIGSDAKCDALMLYSSNDLLYKAVVSLQLANIRIIRRK